LNKVYIVVTKVFVDQRLHCHHPRTILPTSIPFLTKIVNQRLLFQSQRRLTNVFIDISIELFTSVHVFTTNIWSISISLLSLDSLFNSQQSTTTSSLLKNRLKTSFSPSPQGYAIGVSKKVPNNKYKESLVFNHIAAIAKRIL